MMFNKTHSQIMLSSSDSNQDENSVSKISGDIEVFESCKKLEGLMLLLNLKSISNKNYTIEDSKKEIIIYFTNALEKILYDKRQENTEIIEIQTFIKSLIIEIMDERFDDIFRPGNIFTTPYSCKTICCDNAEFKVFINIIRRIYIYYTNRMNTLSINKNIPPPQIDFTYFKPSYAIAHKNIHVHKESNYKKPKIPDNIKSDRSKIVINSNNNTESDEEIIIKRNKYPDRQSNTKRMKTIRGALKTTSKPGMRKVKNFCNLCKKLKISPAWRRYNGARVCYACGLELKKKY
ncbi:hypothetical protein SLOPH_1099 [Spraguea lophii 42_110]|uniref:GATA-type domain-containing protein n=1 Tax=Spraguea lophii (strain 42_110) TaxID=1358809 RepID=S7W6W3_SPRLO|nr:hypothetical protein SLOPH_1099 [Spraguea lophii 42_110]